MKFTPRIFIGVLCVLLAIGVAVGMSTHPARVPVSTVAVALDNSAIVPAIQLGSPSEYYQPVSSWYKNKHWWKRNAPIIGGAGGGALVGGLVGGGTGAIIGGAAGGGGGYLYKRHKDHHRYRHQQQYRYR
jgi:hypothetical protein